MDKPLQDPTLLIVENDTVFRDQLAKVMANRGFDPIKASGLTEAVAAIKARHPAYAVIDLHLDDGSGLEVVEMLKQVCADARAIILTGYGNTPTAVAAVKLGAIDYIAKPADADEIVDALLAPEGNLPPAPDNPISPEEAKRIHIERFLERTDGNITRTARLLNMHRRTLQRILKRSPEAGPDDEDPDHDTAQWR
ncbi:response regulator transcription factor [Roseovarius aestuariivivens]|uniref:response regulator transcription factor n=1 Tax=Roseovarius aestuariivivens TaxID=1888910 RepID=UPI0010816BB3|nr:response regulator [Roseovarius aestuariivivens]